MSQARMTMVLGAWAMALLAAPAAVTWAVDVGKDRARTAQEAAAGEASAKPAPAATPPRDPVVEERPGAGPLTDEQMATVMELIRAQRPALAARIDVLGAEERREAINRALPRFRGMLEMKRKDPQGFELHKQQWILEGKAGELARRLSAAKAGEAEKLRADLRAVVEQQIDIRTKMLDHDVSKLENRIAQIRSEIQQQQSNRKQMIEHQLKRLLSAPPAEETPLPRKLDKPGKAETKNPRESK